MTDDPERTRRVRVSTRDQVVAWLSIGIQSIGGGAATLLLMRRTAVRRGWISAQTFAEDWALSRLSPGMHMVALAGLVGQRAGGWRGVAIAVVGMLGPSVLITVALTAGYDAVRDVELVQRVFIGMGATALGLSIGTQLRMARDTSRSGRAVVVDSGVFAAAIGLGLLFPFAPLLTILAGTVVGVLFLGSASAARPRRSHADPDAV